MIEATSKKNNTCFSIILPIKNVLNDSEVKLNE